LKEVILWQDPKGEREETTKILNNLVSIKGGQGFCVFIYGDRTTLRRIIESRYEKENF
jgi:hypothetical protein